MLGIDGKRRVSEHSKPQHVAQQLVIIALVMSLVLGPITVLRLLAPDGPWDALFLVTLLVTLEGAMTTRWLTRSGREVNNLAYRMAELIVLLLALRLVTWAITDTFPSSGWIRRYLLEPSAIVDAYFIGYVVVAVFAWERVTSMSRSFDRLALSPSENSYFSAPVGERSETGLEAISVRNRARIVQGFAKGWAVGGLLLALFAAITTFDVSVADQLTNGGLDLRTLGRLGLRPEMLGALIVYFAGGLWLVSQGRLAVMRIRWLADDTIVDMGVARQWHRLSLAVLIAVAIVAAFLPIGSTLAISRILQAAAAVVVQIIALLIGLFSVPFYLLSTLLGRDATEESISGFDPSLLFQPSESAPPANETSALIFGTFFWMPIIIITVVSAFYFLRGRGVPLEFEMVTFAKQQLLNWLRTMWHALVGRGDSFRTLMRGRLGRNERTPNRRPRKWRFIRLNSLTPRERVRYFYLSTIRRAAQKGVERADGETPLEYASELKSGWPDADEDLDVLTEAFVKARYSVRPITEDDLGPLKRAWLRIKTALRRESRN